jgi:hypothetical protein
MATSGSNPREIQDRDKKAGATTGAQHPGGQDGDAVRVRSEQGWVSGSKSEDQASNADRPGEASQEPKANK